MDPLRHGRCSGVIVVGCNEVGRSGRARLIVYWGTRQRQAKRRIRASSGSRLGQRERVVLDDIPRVRKSIKQVVDGRQTRVVVLERGRVEQRRGVDDGGDDGHDAGGGLPPTGSWYGYRWWSFRTERRADGEWWMALDHAASARRGIWTGHFSIQFSQQNGSALVRSFVRFTVVVVVEERETVAGGRCPRSLTAFRPTIKIKNI